MRCYSWWAVLGTRILAGAAPLAAAVPACHGQSQVYPCAIAGTLLVASAPIGTVFSTGNLAVNFINDPQSPGLMFRSSAKTFVQFGQLNLTGSLSLATVTGQVDLVGVRGSITCGVTGNATVNLTLSGAGATTTISCPKMPTAGMVATVVGQPSSASPLGSLVENIVVSGKAPTMDDTISITGYALEASFASTAPSIIIDGTGVINGGSNEPGNIVSGSWVAVKGSGFADPGETEDWSSSDFSQGLPNILRGVQVLFNGQPGAMWRVIDGTPQQINVQAPANLNGNVSVQVVRNSTPSNTVTTTAVQAAPGIFSYSLDGGHTFYPSAVLLDGTILGDPAILAGVRKAKAGDIVALFANSLAPSPAGVVTVSGTTHSVTVTIGPLSFLADYSGLVAPGEFQINITVPSLPNSGNYPITIQVDGQTSQAGVIFPYTN